MGLIAVASQDRCDFFSFLLLNLLSTGQQQQQQTQNILSLSSLALSFFFFNSIYWGLFIYNLQALKAHDKVVHL